jgi:1-deoxy-D-xylulose-5-phosphate synthase
MRLIDTINCPADLKKLSISQLNQVATEIREVMLDVVSRHGGHLASSLGAVELTIALHYCYNAPIDKLVWDVGHQAYAHKILTGRRDKFKTLRQLGGISGFVRTCESDYDAISVGHASTSISAGLGLAMGRNLKGEKHSVIAIIGDGSLSGGLAFEGLNNLGSLSTNMTVVLNDNRMSISKNVGALSRYLMRVITDRRFNKIKSEIWELAGHFSNVGKRIRSLVHNIDETLKHFVIPGKLFEDMGLRYLGPVNGHNIAEMIEVFKFVRESTVGPVLVHVLTT